MDLSKLPSKPRSITPFPDARHPHSEDYLFEPPPDLLCPITAELFVDPVLNAAGQVYERSAFMRYLNGCGRDPVVDPVTRIPLAQQFLTPVVVMRSRAMEYRERVARRCVELACQKDCPTPLKYVRRAAELVDGVEMSNVVPGLTNACISYLNKKPHSRVYDLLALESFADGLKNKGLRDQAASVYYNLLRFGEDKSQQSDLLKKCVECWAGDGAGDGTDPDNVALQKLTAFVEEQQALSWSQIIDIMYEAGINERLTLHLCEGLLSRSPGDEEMWKAQKEVLIRYVTIQCARLAHQQDSTAEDVEALKSWKAQLMKEEASSARRRRGTLLEAVRQRRKPFWRRKRFLASVCFCVANLLPGTGLILKLSRTLPVLAMVHSGCSPGDTGR
eukprot:evm.model.scf_886.3 EVM.evm.TU.scf_886.3   scf_886:24885-28521(+)